MNAGAAPRRITRKRAPVVLGVAFGVVLSLTVFAAAGEGVLTHTVCRTGALESNQAIWTPWELVNAPYLGHTIWGGSFDTWGLFGPTHVTLSNGNLSKGNISTGYFETQNWSVYDQSSQTELGPGANHPCNSPYLVKLAHTTFDVSVDGQPLQGPGNTTNANEPTTFDCSLCSPGGPSIPSAIFSNGFVRANLPPVTTCGVSGRDLNFSSESFDVSIPTQTDHGPILINLSISSQANYTYYFPPNGGTWQIDDLQENMPGLRGQGLAFNWRPC